MESLDSFHNSNNYTGENYLTCYNCPIDHEVESEVSRTDNYQRSFLKMIQKDQLLTVNVGPLLNSIEVATVTSLVNMNH